MNDITERDCAKTVFWCVVVIVIGAMIDQGAVAIVGLIGFFVGLGLLWRME